MAKMIEKPSHYRGMAIDVIAFCQKNNLDFMQGNVIKYICRYKEKGGIEDLNKAIAYIERMIFHTKIEGMADDVNEFTENK